jgi:hypothetical protein
MRQRFPLMHAFVLFAEALIISWALIYLIEYFDWHWVREAGGGFLRLEAGSG